MNDRQLPNNNHTPRAKAPARRRGRRILVVCLLLATVLAVAKAAPWFLPAGQKPAAEQESPQPELLDDRYNLLVLGVDQRPGDVGRSDVMMLVSVNKSGQPFILSIPRDTRVQVPGREGFTKINHAYAWGGPELSMQTVSEFLGIHIDGYVTVNLESFQTIIDAVGGVDIEIDKRMSYHDSKQGLVIDLPPGEQHLNGEQAMQYVRWRSDGLGDEGRVQRQLKFVNALGKSVMSANNLFRLSNIVRACYDSVDTNIGLGTALRILATGMKTYENGLNTKMLPGEGEYINRVCYFIPDLEKMYKLIAENLFDDSNRQQYLAKVTQLLQRYNG